jgi:hypothetical protein
LCGESTYPKKYKIRKKEFFIALFEQMSLFLFISKIRINIFSIKDLAKKRDNVFAYIFIKICANFAQVGRMKITQNL